MTDKIEYGTGKYYQSMVADTTLALEKRARALWEKSQLKLKGHPERNIKTKWDKWDKEEFIRRIKEIDNRRNKVRNIANQPE
tara:strand:+ start:2206 stop:2451 length:246 start_codon:yes stop_codon:yes gene_type:complete